MSNCVNYCSKKEFGIQGLTRLREDECFLKRNKSGHLYPLLSCIIRLDYLSTPANAATDEALDLSTNPGPDGIFAPGSNPAPLLYRCNTIIGM